MFVLQIPVNFIVFEISLNTNEDRKNYNGIKFNLQIEKTTRI